MFQLSSNSKPQTAKEKCCFRLRENALSLCTLAGVLVGVGISFIVREYPLSDVARLWINMPGNIYLRLLQLTILPMIAGRVLLVSAGLNPQKHGWIGLSALIYIVFANFLGSGIGFTVALLLEQQQKVDANATELPTVTSNDTTSTSDILADLLLNLFPANILGVGVYSEHSYYKLVPCANQSDNASAVHQQLKRMQGLSPTVNMIGLLFTAMIMGFASCSVGQQSEPLLAFFDSTATVVERIVKWVLKLTPIGVCFMVAGAMVGVRGDFTATIARLGMFLVVVLIGLAIQLIVLMLLVFVVTKRNPFTFFFVHGANAYLISLATGIPLVAVPHIYEASDRSGISTRVSRFVAPLGAVVKADGSAVFVAAAFAFSCALAKVHSVQVLGMGTLLGTLLLFAAPPVPSASMIILITMLSSVNVRADEAIGLLFAIDWLVDRLRSGNNTLSTLTCILMTNYFGNFLDSDTLPLRDPIEELTLVDAIAIDDDFAVNDTVPIRA